MKVLLSIKPQFVEKIISGEKKYEYRKRIFKKDIETIVIYSTLPEGMIIGEFKVKRVLKENPSVLWNLTKDKSGISKEYFREYFENREVGYALEIIDFKEYDKPINPKVDLDNFTAPQSFAYIEDTYLHVL